MVMSQKEFLKVQSAVKCGYEVGGVGDSVNLAIPNSKTRRGRVGHQIANTLDTGCQIGVIVDAEDTENSNAME